MATRKRKPKEPITVATLRHEEAKRKNIPSVEQQSVTEKEQQQPITLRYPRNTDLDPQLVWRGKDQQDWSDLVVKAPPIYIQEKVHPKVLIDDLLAQTKADKQEENQQIELFSDFNGIPEGVDKTEFYAHDQNWTNRMILGDSLQVMASLAEREGLRNKVQCIYLDPPYGIKFNSNFQWSTTSTTVKDGKADHITREPEQVKAFRDTWRDGIHSYLTYLRDRLTVARDLLTDSGSIFVQIGDENVHRVRAVMDEVFGEENFVSQISFQTTSGFETSTIASVGDFLIWYAKKKDDCKVRQLYDEQIPILGEGNARWVLLPNQGYRGISASEKRGETELPEGSVLYKPSDLQSQNPAKENQLFEYNGRFYRPNTNSHWKASFPLGMSRLAKSSRIHIARNSIQYQRRADDFPVMNRGNLWTDTITGSFTDSKVYIVQTNVEILKRCILMTSDPGDLVLDPTCGSGTAAYVAEQWGRRWITIDTSRVALALARARIMGARYPFYLLNDSREGQMKEGEVTASAPSSQPTFGNIRHGFVYERVPHITLKSIANNTEIDVIWDHYEEQLVPLREQLSKACGLKKTLEEWEVPREIPEKWQPSTAPVLKTFWDLRFARQREIDDSIAANAKADSEYLYDKPYDDKKKVRVAGPFTVESLSPHRVLGVDENDDLIDPNQVKEGSPGYAQKPSFAEMILENLRVAGVQQAHKEDRIEFTSLQPWPGEGLVCAEGRYREGEQEKRAGILIGPEFGTVQRADLVEAARECGDAGFDVLIACAFNYDALAGEFKNLGRVPVLKARMNADLHMAEDLKTTQTANLFVIFGEPDISLIPEKDNTLRIRVNGVDVFKPQTGEVISDNADGIACWFIDTEYNGESFFVRHAYFLGANDPYSSLKTTLKAEINQEAWDTLHSDTSRPFPKPKSSRIAVKVINHLGDEVMKVFRIQ